MTRIEPTISTPKIPHIIPPLSQEFIQSIISTVEKIINTDGPLQFMLLKMLMRSLQSVTSSMWSQELYDMFSQVSDQSINQDLTTILDKYLKPLLKSQWISK